MTVKTDRETEYWSALFDGQAEGHHPACRKQSGVGLLVVTSWLELCTSRGSSCHHSPPPSSLAPNKIQNGDTRVPANPAPPGKWPLKRREKHCYCCCYHYCFPRLYYWITAWHDGATSRALDLQTYRCASVTKQYNLVPANGWWSYTAEKNDHGSETNGNLAGFMALVTRELTVQDWISSGTLHLKWKSAQRDANTARWL